ncbi:MAG: hypothetical protein Q4B40_06280 [Clostridia bacterium]|nr:hypothetical protein [Clostridia bacterium]
MKINVLKKLSLAVMIVLFIALFGLTNFGFGGYDSPIITVINILLSVVFLAVLFLTAFLQSRKNSFIITYTVLFAMAVISTVITQITHTRGLNMYLHSGLLLLLMVYYAPILPLVQLISNRSSLLAPNTAGAITIIASFLVVYLIALTLHFAGRKILPHEPPAEIKVRRPLWHKALKIASPILLLAVQLVLFVITGFGLIDYYNSTLKIILSIAFILLLMLTAYLYSNKNTFVIIYSSYSVWAIIMLVLPSIIEFDSATLLYVLGMTYFGALLPLIIPIADGFFSTTESKAISITIGIVVLLAVAAVHFIGKKFKKK